MVMSDAMIDAELFQKHHLTCFFKASTFNPNKINTAWLAGSVPMNHMVPNNQITVHKGCDLNTKNIIDYNSYMAIFWQVIPYGCSRIERVGVILV